MTHSAQDQMANISLAFRLLMEGLDARSIAVTLFYLDREPFSSIYNTTWKELEIQHWIEVLEIDGQPCCRFTGLGWLEALYQIGLFQDEALKRKMGEYAAILKNYVKGREQDKVISFNELVRETELSEGWVFNAIESGLLQKSFGIHDATWLDRGFLVKIPLNFGVKRIDHAADIRAQLESTQEELERAKERLSEVTCSFCGAPIIAQGSFPISDHADGYYESYACGRYNTDGFSAQPCPQDPKFPKFEEYELIFKEFPEDSFIKWNCWAKPITYNANRFYLHPEFGKTKEEATQKVIERYNRAITPWNG
jgi:hypothetical protein